MKKRFMSAVACTMAATIVLSGCNVQKSIDSIDESVVEMSKEEATEEASIDASVEASTEVSVVEAEKYIPPTTTPGEYDSPELLEGEVLSDEELEQLREYFSNIENYGFTLSSYETPTDINWIDVFECGAGIKDCDYSKDALNQYFSTSDSDYSQLYIPELDDYEGLKALSGKDVKAFVESKTGITDFDISILNNFYYIESEDVLFSFVDPFIYEDNITCVAGAKNGNTVQVVIQFSEDGRYDRRITLEETGDSANPYHFCSNRQLWEKSADDIIVVEDQETGEKLACSVNNKSKGVVLKPVRNNVVCSYAKALINETDSREFSSIREVVLRDVDGDGLSDTIAILTFGDDVVPVLCMGDHENWGVTYCSEAKSAVTKWLSDNVSDMTADNVISFILEHQDELKSF